MTIQNIIWDCDGVLVDSEIIAMRVAAEIVHEALIESGREGVDIDAFIVNYAGKHFSHMLEDCGLADANGDLDTIKMQRTIDELTAHVETFPRLKETLQYFKNKGVRMAVATSSELSRVVPCLEKHGLLEFFTDAAGKSHVYSAVDSLEKPKLKPEPHIYLHAMKQIGATQKNTIAVEDSPSGVKSARAAGLRVMAFTGAHHIPLGQAISHGERLKELGAEWRISSYADMPEIVSNIRPSFEAKWVPLAPPGSGAAAKHEIK